MRIIYFLYIEFFLRLSQFGEGSISGIIDEFLEIRCYQFAVFLVFYSLVNCEVVLEANVGKPNRVHHIFAYLINSENHLFELVLDFLEVGVE